MKPTILKAAKAITALLALLAVVITILYASGLSYIYCSFRESSWQKAINEKDLEARLFAFYSKSSIVPGQSYMGRDHVLAQGQRMTRYQIFAKEPLDIVYNKDGTIAAFYVSYE